MRRSSNPLIGPTLTPWSIGTMMALPVVRLNIRSSRTDFPISMCKDNSGEIIKIVHNLSPQATPRLRQSEPRSIMDPCRYSLCAHEHRYARLGYSGVLYLSLIHISEPTRLGMISYAVFCLKKKKKTKQTTRIK